VPPCINKYYLLDLGAGNSLVEYAVAQGHHVFLISWRSAIPETGHLTWDDYLEMGPLTAIDVVLGITKAKRTHALGFCVGGTILSCAAAVLAAKEKHKLETLTLLTTMLDFSDTGEIGLPVSRIARGHDREGRYTSREGTGLHLWHATRQRPDLALCRR
jgi:polyhydroxyalkanoate synthase